MDPLSAIVGAIAAGATAAASGVANKVVSDAYDALKNLVASRFGRKAAIEAVGKRQIQYLQKTRLVER
jgi:hypothetical protein